MKKWAVITGAAGGIGGALVDKFAANGYSVLAIDSRNVRERSSVYFLNVDLESLADNADYASDIERDIFGIVGADPVAVLINNAASQILSSIENITRDEWRKSFSINLTAAFFLAQILFSALAKSSGSVVNIGSIHAFLTKPKFVIYATTKSALLGLTRAMAVEAGDRVRFNAIMPAAISTPMLLAGFDGDQERFSELERHHPSAALGQPEEVADAAYFLAISAKFTNGAIFNLDGGIGSRLHDPV